MSNQSTAYVERDNTLLIARTQNSGDFSLNFFEGGGEVPRRGRCDRTPTQHGALIIHYMMLGRRWTTAEWAKYLGVSHQGALRIMNILESEHEFALGQDEKRRWTLYEGGEPVQPPRPKRRGLAPFLHRRSRGGQEVEASGK